MATAPVFDSKARNAEKIRNVSAIISVDDVLSTLLWYQDKLGMQVEFVWGDPVVHGSVIVGDSTFHFSRSDPTKPRTATSPCMSPTSTSSSPTSSRRASTSCNRPRRWSGGCARS